MQLNKAKYWTKRFITHFRKIKLILFKSQECLSVINEVLTTDSEKEERMVAADPLWVPQPQPLFFLPGWYMPCPPSWRAAAATKQRIVLPGNKTKRTSSSCPQPLGEEPSSPVRHTHRQGQSREELNPDYCTVLIFSTRRWRPQPVQWPNRRQTTTTCKLEMWT